MKTVGSKEVRQVLLHELRRATCLQVSIWDSCCDVIDEALGPSTAISRVIEVTPAYAGQQLKDADLDSILSGLKEMNLDSIFEAMNAPAPIGQGKKMRGTGNLGAEVRLSILKALSKRNRHAS